MTTTLHGTYLVIDDDETLRNLLEIVIKGAGGTARSAGEPETARRLICELGNTVSCVLLDLNLDSYPGENLYQHIVSNMPDAAIFAMSGISKEEIQQRFGDFSLDGIIAKPFVTSDLIRAIANRI